MWPRFPLIHLFFPFVLGILYGGILPVLGSHIFGNTVLVLILILYLFFAIHGKAIYAFRWLPGLYMIVLYFLLGLNLRIVSSKQHLPENIMNESGKYHTMLGRLKDPPEEKANSYKSVFEVYAIWDNNAWNTKSGKMLVYFEKESNTKIPLSGELILIRSKINAISSPGNPGQFDYAKYLLHKQISQQSYLRADAWKILRNRKSGIRILALDLRKVTIGLLKNNAPGESEFAVASAILLGNKDWLDRETIKDFSDAGAMHILCVSGMHVGIIYIIVNVLLAFLDRNRKTKWLKTVLILLSIWFYAMITGLSSPVLRASIMFSFMTIGRSFQRYTNIYNTLVASAILLLILDPCLLLDAGFQLSYSAVIGIVTLQPLIERWWNPKNWFTKRAWALVTVSLAAQLSILPISLFYFHKFPVYFIATNLMVIPLVTIILYSGILFLVFSQVGFMSGLLSRIFFSLVRLLNTSVQFIEELPFSAIDEISVNGVEVIILYALIIFGGFFLLFKKKILLFFSLLTLLVFSIEQFVNKAIQVRSRQIVVYQVRRNSAYDFIFGESNYLLADSMVYKDAVNLDFNIRGNWIKQGLKKHIHLNHVQNKKFLSNN